MSGPCLCGDPYCPRCGDPGLAVREAAEEAFWERINAAKLDEDELSIVLDVGLAAVEASRAAVKRAADARAAIEEEARQIEEASRLEAEWIALQDREAADRERSESARQIEAAGAAVVEETAATFGQFPYCDHGRRLDTNCAECGIASAASVDRVPRRLVSDVWRNAADVSAILAAWRVADRS